MAINFWLRHDHQDPNNRKHAAKRVAQRWKVSVKTVLKYKKQYEAEAKKFIAETLAPPVTTAARPQMPQVVLQAIEEMIESVVAKWLRIGGE